MKVKDFINLLDFPQDVTLIIYSYKLWDDVFEGKAVDLPKLSYLQEENVNGFELPAKNTLILNIRL